MAATEGPRQAGPGKLSGGREASRATKVAENAPLHPSVALLCKGHFELKTVVEEADAEAAP